MSWRHGTVRVVGTGLLGTSIALSLRERGTEVILDDISPSMLALARDLGAGRLTRADDEPSLVVVASPPDVAAAVVLTELDRYPNAVVTDVASVKLAVLEGVRDGEGDLTRYLGSHPMAGRERSGAIAARGDLFVGRPWVLCPTAETSTQATEMVRDLVLSTGAIPLTLDAGEHDAAVAVVSHVPQVASSLVAGRLLGASPGAVNLAGQGLRDVTRIAGSDPALWVQILAGNAGPLAAVLTALRDDLSVVVHAVERLAQDADAPGARAELARALDQGSRGFGLIPGKHGEQATRYEIVTVVVPDQPGSLGRLFTEMGQAEINLEEITLEHVPGRAIGLAEISVLPAVREAFLQMLNANGWRVLS